MPDIARRIVNLSGKDCLTFLQGLVSNDVLPLAQADGVVWAALLTAQGKYLADFMVVRCNGQLLLDLPQSQADSTLQRFSMYRLRADVVMTPSRVMVTRGLGPAPLGAMPDPRHPDLGWRHYGAAPGAQADVDWDAIRVTHLIPESGIELIANDSYILENGFERLHGVDFRKGCYVGQEVTARMKHKTLLRKGLVRVKIDAQVPVGTVIFSDDKEAGTVFTQSGGRAIAWLRLDRSAGDMTAGGARVTLDE